MSRLDVAAHSFSRNLGLSGDSIYGAGGVEQPSQFTYNFPVQMPSCTSPCAAAPAPKVVMPGNVQALIPSKFKYKFPRELMPRHKSYEVLAVEDHMNAPPLPPPPPKRIYRKKSMFGILKRNQFSPTVRELDRPTTTVQALIPETTGWMKDLRCCLCTSVDYVSTEQAQLEVENAQLDEALAEFQETTRIQSIQILETQKEYEMKLKKESEAFVEEKKIYEDELQRNAMKEASLSRDVEVARENMQKLQEEKEQLYQRQQETEESLEAIRRKISVATEAIVLQPNQDPDGLAEQFRNFCLGLSDVLDKASGTATTTPFIINQTVVRAPKTAAKKVTKKKGAKKGLKKKGQKGDKKAVKGKKKTDGKKLKKGAAPTKSKVEEEFISQTIDAEEPISQTLDGNFHVNRPENDEVLSSKLQFVMYPGMLDRYDPQPNDTARAVMEQRLGELRRAYIQSRQVQPVASPTMMLLEEVINEKQMIQPSFPQQAAQVVITPKDTKSPGAPLKQDSLVSDTLNRGGSDTLQQIDSPSRSSSKSKHSPITPKENVRSLNESVATTEEYAEALTQKMEIIKRKSLGRLSTFDRPPRLPVGMKK